MNAPWPMIGERKRLLFLCAVARQEWEALNDARSRWAVEVLELYADGDATDRDLAVAHAEARAASDAVARSGADERHRLAALLAAEATSVASQHLLDFLPLRDPRPPVRRPLPVVEERLFANRPYLHELRNDLRADAPPLDSLLDPAWLAWRGGLVRSLAEDSYEQHAFEQLPILADALEDAGCTLRGLLHHLRSSGPHARGCWALDLLLGRELYLPDNALVLRTHLPPRYRTLRCPVEVEGREATQSGGRGRFGAVRLRIEPWPGPGSVVLLAAPLHGEEAQVLGQFGMFIPTGVLDGLAGHTDPALAGLRLTVADVRWHDVGSMASYQALAFRLAAADAIDRAVEQGEWTTVTGPE